MKAFILLFIAVLCAPAGLRAGGEIEHLTDVRAHGIVKVWWDKVARKQFLERLSLRESDFVAVCVGDTKLVCSMPAGYADDASARDLMDAMQLHHDMNLDIRRHDVERNDESEWLISEASNAFVRAQHERDALIRFADAGSKRTAKEQCDLRRKEESKRLDRLLDRFSRGDGSMSCGDDENTRLAWEKVYAEMRRRGVSAANIEFLRHERELMDAHHREFRPHERMVRNRMLREEVRDFERWLEMRVSEDRMVEQHMEEKSVRRRRETARYQESRNRNGQEMAAQIAKAVRGRWETARYQESRIRNGQEMAAQIAKAEEKKQKKKRENDCAERTMGVFFVIFGVFLCIIVREFFKCKASGEQYDAQNRNLQPCAYCGRTRSTTHPIYHSVVRSYHVVGSLSALSHCGFAIYTCDECLAKHKRGILMMWTFRGIWMAVCILLGLMIATLTNEPLMKYFTVLLVSLGGSIGGLLAMGHFDGYFRPWKSIAKRASRHCVLAYERLPFC